LSGGAGGLCGVAPDSQTLTQVFLRFFDFMYKIYRLLKVSDIFSSLWGHRFDKPRLSSFDALASLHFLFVFAAMMIIAK